MPVVKNVGFLKKFGTLYDLLIYSVDNANKIISSSEGQLTFFKAIYVLKTVISSMKNGITDQSEERQRKMFAERESFLNNAELLLEKEGDN